MLIEHMPRIAGAGGAGHNTGLTRERINLLNEQVSSIWKKNTSEVLIVMDHNPLVTVNT
jgi:hypothetical protein